MDSYREIEKLIYNYAEWIDAGNLEAVAQLFTHAEFISPDGRVAARGAEQVLAMQRRTPAPDPSAISPKIPGELAAIILRCLAKDPADRIASAKDLEDALRRVAEEL